MTTTAHVRGLDLTTIARLDPLTAGQTAEGFAEVQRYLRAFGYLKRGSYQQGLLDEETALAIQKYQSHNAVPITGEFDQDTREQLTEARCALPDLSNGVAFGTTCAWNRRVLTYAFDIGTTDVAGGQEFDAVRAAFRTWESATPLIFREVGLPQAPDIRIGWRNAHDTDLSMIGGTLAHADFPPGCSVVTGKLPLPVHFDDSEHTWSVGALASAFDIQTVALHEIGHILGLGHSSVRGAVMFPSVSAGTVNTTLTADDVAGIQSLYPESTWTDIGHANGVTALTAQDAKLYCVTSNNRLWQREPVAWDVSWTDIGHANGVTAMTAINGKLFCTSNNRLWQREPVPWEVDWVEIGHANDVTTMAALNGMLYATTGNGRLWVREPVPWDVDWVDIGHANDVTGMTAIEGKLYCATGNGRLWLREPVPWDVDWVDIGHANDVTGMAAVSGSLFCTTSGNRLWMRAPGP